MDLVDVIRESLCGNNLAQNKLEDFVNNGSDFWPIAISLCDESDEEAVRHLLRTAMIHKLKASADTLPFDSIFASYISNLVVGMNNNNFRPREISGVCLLIIRFLSNFEAFVSVELLSDFLGGNSSFESKFSIQSCYCRVILVQTLFELTENSSQIQLLFSESADILLQTIATALNESVSNLDRDTALSSLRSLCLLISINSNALSDISDLIGVNNFLFLISAYISLSLSSNPSNFSKSDTLIDGLAELLECIVTLSKAVQFLNGCIERKLTNVCLTSLMKLLQNMENFDQFDHCSIAIVKCMLSFANLLHADINDFDEECAYHLLGHLRVFSTHNDFVVSSMAIEGWVVLIGKKKLFSVEVISEACQSMSKIILYQCCFSSDCNEGDHERFREQFVSEACCIIYSNQKSYYLEQLLESLENLLQLQDSIAQIEGAIFMLTSPSKTVCKRALIGCTVTSMHSQILYNVSRAGGGQETEVEIAEDGSRTCELLAKILDLILEKLTNVSDFRISCAISRLIGSYAAWIVKWNDNCLLSSVFSFIFAVIPFEGERLTLNDLSHNVEPLATNAFRNICLKLDCLDELSNLTPIAIDCFVNLMLYPIKLGSSNVNDWIDFIPAHPRVILSQSLMRLLILRYVTVYDLNCALKDLVDRLSSDIEAKIEHLKSETIGILFDESICGICTDLMCISQFVRTLLTTMQSRVRNKQTSSKTDEEVLIMQLFECSIESPSVLDLPPVSLIFELMSPLMSIISNNVNNCHISSCICDVCAQFIESIGFRPPSQELTSLDEVCVSQIIRLALQQLALCPLELMNNFACSLMDAFGGKVNELLKRGVNSSKIANELCSLVVKIAEFVLSVSDEDESYGNILAELIDYCSRTLSTCPALLMIEEKNLFHNICDISVSNLTITRHISTTRSSIMFLCNVLSYSYSSNRFINNPTDLILTEFSNRICISVMRHIIGEADETLIDAYSMLLFGMLAYYQDRCGFEWRNINSRLVLDAAIVDAMNGVVNTSCEFESFERRTNLSDRCQLIYDAARGKISPQLMISKLNSL